MIVSVGDAEIHPLSSVTPPAPWLLIGPLTPTPSPWLLIASSFLFGGVSRIL